MKVQSFKVLSLKHQIQSCLRLIIGKVKSAIIRLLDLESALEAALNEQFSEIQVKEAFEKANGCLKRYWRPEMVGLIPRLIGLTLRSCDPWDWMVQFAPIREMAGMGWSDRQIVYCIDASKILAGQNPF
jgi:hypothetical protein